MKYYLHLWRRFEVVDSIYIAHPINIFGQSPSMLNIIEENDANTCIKNQQLYEGKEIFFIPNVKNFQKTNDSHLVQDIHSLFINFLNITIKNIMVSEFIRMWNVL